MPGREREHDDVPARILERVRIACDRFHARFRRAPTLAAFAPGRVNLIGEHTDYNQGFVLPMAIEREVVIVADRTCDQTSTFVSDAMSGESTARLTQPLSPKPGDPVNYLLGVADQFHRMNQRLPDIDAMFVSTIPVGAGLASSAALEVAFALLLARLVDRPMSFDDTARICRAAEHAFPGVPVGIMDMFVSAGARAGHAMLLDCRDETALRVPADFHRMGAGLLIIDTGVKHALASGEYAKRREECIAAARALNVNSLRDATIDDMRHTPMDPVQRRRTRHVVSENQRTSDAATALERGDLQAFGRLMFESHSSLREDFEVSCAELDAIVNTAADMRDRGAGVLGARMTGGGFGGCAIVLCQTDSVDAVRDHLCATFTRRFGRKPGMSFASSAAGGARVLNV